MNRTPAILSFFDDESTREEWEPALAPFPVQEMALHRMEKRPSPESNVVPQAAVIWADVYAARGREIVRRLRERHPRLDVVVLASFQTPEIPLWSLAADRVRHLIVADPAEEGARIQAVLRTLAAKSRWEFSSSLDPGFDSRTFRLFDRGDKEPIIGEIESLVSGDGPDLEMLRQKCALMADEMIENAVRAAPEGALSKQGIVVEAGFDGETLALQVADGWGALTPEKALEHLARHQDGPPCADGGGGRGLFILWQFFDHFHINIASGVETAIGGELRRSSPKAPGQLKGYDFFHIVSSDHVPSPHSFQQEGDPYV